MTDERIDISRRTVLGAVGTIGVASAGAGLGTSAFLSDEEEFEDNSIAAGTLDLHVGWEAHYANDSDDEYTDIGELHRLVSGETADPSRVSLPLDAATPENGSLVTVDNVSQARQFLNNTEYDSYANVTEFDPSTVSGDPCQYLASGADQSPVIIDLDDVKPGDFGEVTFSFALCDNPGYVWMRGGLQSAAEGGLTEPEESADVDGDADSTDPADVELLDEARAAMWYDDGDNLQLGGGTTGSGGPVCVELVLDASGSMGDPSDSSSKTSQTIDGATSLAQKVLDANSDNRVGVTFFSADAYDEGAQNQLSVGSPDSKTFSVVSDAIDDLPGNGGDTAIGAGIDVGQTDLQSCPDTHDRVMVVLSNGSENVESDSAVVSDAEAVCNAGTRIFTISIGADTADQAFMEDVACSPNDAFVGADASAIEGIFDELSGQILAQEEVFFRGTLREALNELTADPGSGDFGIPLDGDRSTPYDETGDPASSGSREPYSAGTRHDLGFAWWLPTAVGNAVQSDSATFSLGFYTEQARNNDGAGTS